MYVNCLRLLPSDFIVHSLNPLPSLLRSLSKTIFPFTLPFVCAVADDSCALELASTVVLLASTFRALVVANTATARQIDKSKHAGLAWIELKRISNIRTSSLVGRLTTSYITAGQNVCGTHLK